MSGHMVNVTIQVPKADLALLRETLKLSHRRDKDPAEFIKRKALDSALGLASSTVWVRDWKRLTRIARKLGVESPV